MTLKTIQFMKTHPLNEVIRKTMGLMMFTQMTDKQSVLFIQTVIALLTIDGVLSALNSAYDKEHCSVNVTACEPLQYKTCLGASLPYTHTSTELAFDSSTQAEIQEKLKLWAGLQNAPRCWDVIQQLLCSVYMPKCDPATDRVELPSQKLCELTRSPCRIVESTRGWPDFLKCDQDHFKSDCKNPATDIKFNVSGRCEPPLIATGNKGSWYAGVEGCGIQCQNPWFSPAEHQEVHTLIGVVGSICLISTLFTVLTFLIDWKNANKYPALILFFINGCFFVGSIGWLAQFLPGAREEIVCRTDGTLRISEPQLGSGESASCAVVFVMVYYFMMAGVMWFAILAYTWHLSFRVLGTPKNAIEGKKGIFHIIAWCTPLVLTIVCLALTKIDGDTVSGICFIGSHNDQYRTAFVLGSWTVSVSHVYRGSLVLLPIAVVIIVGMVFLVKGLITLIKFRVNSPVTISDKATAKIMETIFRIGLFALFALLFVTVTFAVHMYIFTNEPVWIKSFKDYVICEANVTVAKQLSNVTTSCAIENRPNLVAMEVHIFAFFGAGIVMSSWVWNKTTAQAWSRFFRKIFGLPNNNPVKMKKHKMIAQAFNKRREIKNGRMSFSFHSTHDDPLGMKVELNSISSCDMSSYWAAAIPRMVTRRGGMVVPTAGTLRRYSDSDVGSVISTMQFGRRLSSDSHVGQREAEAYSRRKKRRRKRTRNRIEPTEAPIAFRGRRGSVCNVRGGLENDLRRGSGTSLDSRASANIAHISMDKLDLPSSDANSEEIKTIDSRSLPPGVVRGPINGTSFAQPLQPTYLPTNQNMQYSMFTASSLVPPETVEISSLAPPPDGKAGIVPSPDVMTDPMLQQYNFIANANNKLFRNTATDSTQLNMQSGYQRQRRASVMHDIMVIDYDNQAYESASSQN